MADCALCGERNPERARFCLGCGNALTTEGGPGETRKSVTVVFADVVDSTALGERLDPESFRHVMSLYYRAMGSALQAHGGRVEKFVGDAVMAVFGIPQVHEDDALRAVRAAIEMRGALVRLNEELAQWDLLMEIRTGINTGEVVTGGRFASQSAVVGGAVNLAARLEQAARPGEILLGRDTYQLVRDAVEVDAIGGLDLKGLEGMVEAFRLLEVKEGVLGRARRLDSPLVGRERELQLIEQAFERCVEYRTSHLFTVMGPAGVGKSRLVHEFATSQGDAQVVSGRCLPYGEGITFWPVMEMIQEAAGVEREDAPEVTKSKFIALLEGEADADSIAERLLSLLGFAEATSGTEQTFWAVRRFLETLATRRPLVVSFDDIHWAEPTFLDLIEHIAEWAAHVPLLLICQARPEILELKPAWGGGRLNATSILLERLSEEECETLIDNILGPLRLSGAARAHIAEAAEGYPLFVEEMLSMLIDDGLIRLEGDRYVTTKDLTKLSVPPSINSLLAARLERLSTEERQVIERAAVAGKVFLPGAVAELLPEDGRARLEEHLQTMVRKELFRPHPMRFRGESAYQFRHILICEAAYDGISKEKRSELHERFATWLEAATGDRTGEYEAQLGYHLEQAYRYQAELGMLDDDKTKLGLRAAQRLSNAGNRALARGDMNAATNLLTRSLHLYRTARGPDASEVPVELLTKLGDSLMESGELDRAQDTFDEAILLARSSEDARLLAHALVGESFLRLQRVAGNWIEQAAAQAHATRRIFEEVGDDLGIARSLRLLADVGWQRGQMSATERALEEALEYVRRAGDKREEAQILTLFVMAGRLSPTPVAEAIERCNNALERAGGNRAVESAALRALGTFHAMEGHFTQGRDCLEQGVAILRDLGLKLLASSSAQLAAEVEILAGDLDAAERELRRGYDELRRMGEKSYFSTTASMLADVLVSLGRIEEADHLLDISAAATGPEDIDPQIRGAATRSRILARRGAIEDALRVARNALDKAEETDFVTVKAEIFLANAEVARAAGRPDDERAAIERAIELFEQKGVIVGVRRARSLLAAATSA